MKEQDKIIVLGDIHGRTIWKEILDKEQAYDAEGKIAQGVTVVFLGDYVSTHDFISEKEQLSNLDAILTLKEQTPERVVLLRGNHDYQHEGYEKADVSGMFYYVKKHFPVKRFDEDTQWIYIRGHFLFSHAGVSQGWLDKHHLTLDQVNSLKPDDPIFGFDTTDRSDWNGVSPWQSPIWIRPHTLQRHAAGDYIQIVGHTPVKACARMDMELFKKIQNDFYVRYDEIDEKPLTHEIVLCDALGDRSYLVIDNGQLEFRQLPKPEPVKKEKPEEKPAEKAEEKSEQESRWSKMTDQEREDYLSIFYGIPYDKDPNVIAYRKQLEEEERQRKEQEEKAKKASDNPKNSPEA